MTNKTHYEILGVEITSSYYEIDKAYRQLYNECLEPMLHVDDQKVDDYLSRMPNFKTVNS
jgi:DnaJ-class molecular chaperone